MKDLKWFRESNVETPEEHQIYSYERANSFNKGIRRLGISENGQSLLDLFRTLITHIGEPIRKSVSIANVAQSYFFVVFNSIHQGTRWATFA